MTIDVMDVTGSVAGNAGDVGLQAENARLRAQVNELQETMTRMVNERRADDLHQQVYAFHWKMGIPSFSVPAVPDEKRVKLRLVLSAEEFFEQLTAAFPFNRTLEAAVIDEIRYAKLDVDLVDLVDSWADMNFIHQGNALDFGIDMKPIQREVARSNLTKEPGNLREDGKITKGEAFSPPKIERLLREQGWQGKRSARKVVT